MHSNRSDDLTLDRLKSPLVCHFVDCDPIWMIETQRHLARIRSSGRSVRAEKEHEEDSVEIKWRNQTNSCDLAEHVTPHSLVAIRFDLSDSAIGYWKAFLSTIHALYSKQILVVVIGWPFPTLANRVEHVDRIGQYSLAFQAAGAVALFTDIFGCEKLASVIDRAAMMVPFGITDWRTRFVNRMPWVPVSNQGPFDI